jgi:small ligand-binding sensory domain FIST
MDLDEGWVQLFESDLGVGDRLEVMLRDPHNIFESAEQGMARFDDSVGAGAAFGLYIDCAGRTAPLSGTESDEAMVIAGGLPDGFPFLGFYVGREIAPILGRGRPHDWTGVLIAMGEAA